MTCIGRAACLSFFQLDRAHCDGDDEPFITLMAETVEQAFEPYWYVLGAGTG